MLGFLARHFVRDYAAHKRYRDKKLAELEIASTDVMSEHVWSEDKALDVGMTQEQMIQKIKEAKARQRIETGEKPGNRALGDGNR
ncbi:MAG TPA: hypothetical protein VHB46_14500 [Burkholderiales bacterium]|nr:hypothetical protein [Burkholderiales bacterium]